METMEPFFEKNGEKVLTNYDKYGILTKLFASESKANRKKRVPQEEKAEKSRKKYLTKLERCGNLNKLSARATACTL